MKKLIYTVIGILAAGLSIGFFASRTNTPSISPEMLPVDQAATAMSQPSAAAVTPAVEQKPAAVPLLRERARDGKTGASVPAQSPGAFLPALETLVSPGATFDQKQTAWHEFENTNTLDHAIAELERRVKENTQSAEAHAVLGMAYLRKCGMIQDMREQGILAMNADKEFDAALAIDPANWEARFTKAVAMSYWPPQLNKGAEVIENLRVLVDQQEGQTPQPHFAITYLKLGEQYQKTGHSDYARQVFARGAGLFPENQELQSKLRGEGKQ